MNKLAYAAVVALPIIGACSASESDIQPSPEASVDAPNHDNGADSLNIFNDDYIETGHEWVDAELDGEPEHCYVNMSHIIENGEVASVLGSDAGTPCDIGSTILSSLNDGYEDNLEELRSGWDRFIEDAAIEITDGKNEAIYEQNVEHTWVNTIGFVAIENDSSVTIVLHGNESGSYGPGSCSVSGYEPVRYLGSATLNDEEYGIGVLLDGKGNGAPCNAGELVLLNIDTPSAPSSVPTQDSSLLA